RTGHVPPGTEAWMPEAGGTRRVGGMAPRSHPGRDARRALRAALSGARPRHPALPQPLWAEQARRRLLAARGRNPGARDEGARARAAAPDELVVASRGAESDPQG